MHAAFNLVKKIFYYLNGKIVL